MPSDKNKKDRKRVVVEEVETTPSEKAVEEPLEEIKRASEDVRENAEEIEKLADEVQQSTSQVKVENTDDKSKIVEPAASDTSEGRGEELEPKQSNANPLVIIIPGILLLGALLGGIIFYQNSLKGKPTPTPTPTAAALTTPEPTSSPSAQVNLEKYQIKVLNGSGTSGEAGKVQDLLTKAGFVVSSTGNATSYDYTDTVIQVKSDVDTAFVDKLSTTLSKTYSVGKNQTLSSSSKDEVIVIVGSSKAK